MISRVLKQIAKSPIILYRYTLKGFVGAQCRHLPTCSEYALGAIEKNGVWKGYWLTVSRMIRCRPGGTEGFDPVPDLTKTKYPIWKCWKYGIWK